MSLDIKNTLYRLVSKNINITYYCDHFWINYTLEIVIISHKVNKHRKFDTYTALLLFKIHKKFFLDNSISISRRPDV